MVYKGLELANWWMSVSGAGRYWLCLSISNRNTHLSATFNLNISRVSNLILDKDSPWSEISLVAEFNQ